VTKTYQAFGADQLPSTLVGPSGAIAYYYDPTGQLRRVTSTRADGTTSSIQVDASHSSLYLPAQISMYGTGASTTKTVEYTAQGNIDLESEYHSSSTMTDYAWSTPDRSLTSITTPEGSTWFQEGRAKSMTLGGMTTTLIFDERTNKLVARALGNTTDLLWNTTFQFVLGAPFPASRTDTGPNGIALTFSPRL
jgi:hypothetical protein